MARARVFLKPGGPISKQIGSRKFEGQTAHVMTDAAEIFSFKINPLFIVEYLEGDPEAPPKSDPTASKKPSKKDKAKSKGKLSARVEEPEDDEEESDEDESDDEDEEDDEAEEDGPDLSEEALRAQTKAKLVELAKELDIDGVDVSMNKDDIIARIRTARKE